MFWIKIVCCLFILQLPTEKPKPALLVYEAEHPKIDTVALSNYLSRAGVPEELNLQVEQKKLFAEAQARYIEILRQKVSEVTRENSSELDTLLKMQTSSFERMRKNQEQANQYLNDRIENILDPDQMERLLEVIVLAEGINAVLVSPQIRGHLKITEGQFADFERIEAETRKKELETIGIKTENRVSKFSKEAAKLVLLKRSQLDGIRRKSYEEMVATLSDKQREEFEKMKTKPFKFIRPSWANERYWKSDE